MVALHLPRKCPEVSSSSWHRGQPVRGSPTEKSRHYRSSIILTVWLTRLRLGYDLNRCLLYAYIAYRASGVLRQATCDSCVKRSSTVQRSSYDSPVYKCSQVRTGKLYKLHFVVRIVLCVLFCSVRLTICTWSYIQHRHSGPITLHSTESRSNNR